MLSSCSSLAIFLVIFIIPVMRQKTFVPSITIKVHVNWDTIFPLTCLDHSLLLFFSLSSEVPTHLQLKKGPDSSQVTIGHCKEVGRFSEGSFIEVLLYTRNYGMYFYSNQNAPCIVVFDPVASVISFMHITIAKITNFSFMFRSLHSLLLC